MRFDAHKNWCKEFKFAKCQNRKTQYFCLLIKKTALKNLLATIRYICFSEPPSTNIFFKAQMQPSKVALVVAKGVLKNVIWIGDGKNSVSYRCEQLFQCGFFLIKRQKYWVLRFWHFANLNSLHQFLWASNLITICRQKYVYVVSQS